MRFYAVCTEAIELTHQALQKLDQCRKGSGRASRALRVATLYGHLQCRAQSGEPIRLGCRDLANAWHLQPRELRADLQDLAAIGWLSYTSSTTGLCIRLHEPQGPCGRGDHSADVSAPDACTPEPQAAESHHDRTPQAAGTIAPATPEPSAEPEHVPAMSQLISAFAEVYNQHKPQSWPAYKPTGAVLGHRLRQAVRQAGGAEAFQALLIQALRGMPEFWRLTYPEGRSGAECASALLKADRASEGRGVEHWHLFSWAAVARRHNGVNGGNTAAVGQEGKASLFHPDHRRACELLFWDGHAWKGKGMAGRELPVSEKQHLAEVLEAAGFGKPGTAAEQFAKEARR